MISTTDTYMQALELGLTAGASGATPELGGALSPCNILNLFLPSAVCQIYDPFLCLRSFLSVTFSKKYSLFLSINMSSQILQ